MFKLLGFVRKFIEWLGVERPLLLLIRILFCGTYWCECGDSSCAWVVLVWILDWLLGWVIVQVILSRLWLGLLRLGGWSPMVGVRGWLLLVHLLAAGYVFRCVIAVQIHTLLHYVALLVKLWFGLRFPIFDLCVSSGLRNSSLLRLLLHALIGG